jgi:mono/diheme cytochrome c family protein
MHGAFATAALATLLVATPAPAEEARLSGAEIYDGACASCHGVDGHGAPQGTAITVPLPDFTDCNFITREGDGNWHYLLVHGGAGLALSPQMPAFGDVLSEEQLHAVLGYIRTFCHDPRWPRGELNFPRLLLITKAFPEDEALLAPEFAKGNGTRDWATELSVEGRVGARGQIEAALPVAVHEVTGGPTTGGVGDATLAYKHVPICRAGRLLVRSWRWFCPVAISIAVSATAPSVSSRRCWPVRNSARSSCKGRSSGTHRSMSSAPTAAFATDSA